MHRPSADSLASLVALREQMTTSVRNGESDANARLDALTADIRARLSEGAVARRLEMSDPSDRALAAELATREAVNPVRSPDDLDRRIATDRALYVVEHPELPGRPLNVLWVALCSELPNHLAEILDPTAPLLAPSRARVAVFYSIWVTEDAFRGIGRGSQLVGFASADIAERLPTVETQSTMSPVPGFRRWADQNSPPDAQRSAADIPIRCAQYLTSLREDGRPLDPVARFHLGNGARLLRVLPDADRSPLGSQRSFGVMANYRYRPEDVVANRDLLASGTVAIGQQVAELLRDGR